MTHPLPYEPPDIELTLSPEAADLALRVIALRRGLREILETAMECSACGRHSSALDDYERAGCPGCGSKDMCEANLVPGLIKLWGESAL